MKKYEEMKLSGGRIAGCILFSIFLFLPLQVLMLTIIGNRIVSTANLKNMICSAVESEDLYEELTDEYMAEALEEMGYEGDVEDVIDNEEMQDFIAGITDNAAEYMISGEGDGAIDVDRVMDFIEEHEEEFEDVTGEKLTRERYKEAEEALEKANEEITEELDEQFEGKSLKEYMLDEVDDLVDENPALGLVVAFFKPLTILIWSLITLVLAAAVCLFAGKQVNFSCKCLGLTDFLAGLPFLGLSAVFNMLIDSQFDLIAELFVDKIRLLFLYAGLTVCILGLALIIAGCIIKVVRISRIKKKATVNNENSSYGY